MPKQQQFQLPPKSQINPLSSKLQDSDLEIFKDSVCHLGHYVNFLFNMPGHKQISIYFKDASHHFSLKKVLALSLLPYPSLPFVSQLDTLLKHKGTH